MTKITINIGNEKLRNKKLNVAFILDCSGSMSSIKDETIKMFNKQLKSIKKQSENIPTKVSFVTFSTKVNSPTMWDVDVKKLKKLTGEDFRPEGWTALNDAIGNTLNKLRQQKRFDEDYLVFVITDGAENHSKEYSSRDVGRLVEELTSTKKWTITYLGTDIRTAVRDYKISIGNTMAFTNTKRSLGTANWAMTRSYGSMLTNMANNSYDNTSFFDNTTVDDD